MVYYGKYKSAVSGTTGCTKTLVTPAQPTIMFAPQITYACDLCHRTHPFSFATAMQVASPAQEQAFDAYCTQRQIERQVEVAGPR